MVTFMNKKHRQLNEDKAPQYEETEGPDEQLGVGSDLEPMNGQPVPPEGIKEKDLNKHQIYPPH